MAEENKPEPGAAPDELTRLAPKGWTPGQVESRFAGPKSFVPASYDAKARTVEAVFATGYRVRRWFGWEELAVREDAIDMKRLALGQLRLLDHHNAYERESVLGYVTEASVEKGALRGVIRFADSDAGREAERQVASGELTGISVGYRINKLVLAETSDNDDDVYRADSWELLEVSLVSVPADPFAGVRSASQDCPTRSFPGAAGQQGEASMAENATAAAPATEPAVNETVRAAEQPGADSVVVRSMVDEAVQAATAAERARVAELTSIAQRSGMEGAPLATAIADATPVAAFRQQAFDKLADDAKKFVPGGAARAQFGGQDSDETRRDAAINALLHRSDPGSVKLTDAARQFRGLTLIELAKDFLEARGESTRGLSKSEVAVRAFHSTSDFPFILENVASKSLRNAYDAYPRTFVMFSRQITASDFKTVNRVQLGEAPQLEKVNESGEFKRGTVKEGKNSIKVDTYGKVVAITRQVLINDDLGAFTRIPSMFGTAIATLESDIVYALITGNVTMGDNVALFHATHKNLVGSGAALSVASIGATRTLLGKQTGLDGKTKINVRARHLLVPTELETAAEQLLNTTIVPEQALNGVPASMRSLNLVVEPRLSDASATAFYLAADPSTIDTIEYAYLEGQEGAYVETRQGFDVDGMEVKCRLDFGAAAIDHRGLAKNPGA